MQRYKWCLLVLLMLFVIPAGSQDQQKVKYAFLFIGDGMGLAQVNLTQAYLSSLDQEIGFEPLTFTQFPVAGLVTTYSADDLTTCSAAAGTALATGYKTDNGRISMSSDKKEIYKTIAEKAKEKGMRIGIVTSVSLNHATPAVFYAHQPGRNMYFEIGTQLAGSNFDYFAGGGFEDPVDTLNGKVVNLMEMARDNGYYTITDVLDVKELAKTRKKVLVTAANPAAGASLPFALDAGSGDMTLDLFTSKGIEMLDGPEGFFMMVEGGKIDWACHANDAGSVIGEVLAFDQAVAQALDFYIKHPQETIIVVTADHETGGLALGNRDTEEYRGLSVFQYQQSSVGAFSRVAGALREKKTGKPDEDFTVYLHLIETSLGLQSEKNNTHLTEGELKFLKDEMTSSLYGSGEGEKVYGESDPLVGAALKVLADRAGISWCSDSHTFTAVPVYAIGAGAQEFDGFMDNTDIPKKLEKLMGIE